MQRRSTFSFVRSAALPTALLFCIASQPARAGDCPEELGQVYTGSGDVACPCFVVGEEAGTVFDLIPPEHFPLEILSIGIGWGSVFGGAPQSLEAALHVYEGGLPNPGAPVYSLAGPLLTDGAINEFPVEGLGFVVGDGPVTVTLEFANENAGTFGPTMIHDGNGCQPGKNVIFAVPGGWLDGCAAGLTGDWVTFLRYQPNCGTSDAPGAPEIVSDRPAYLFPARPNPVSEIAEIEFWLRSEADVDLAIYDASGRRLAELGSGLRSPGTHQVVWDGRDGAGTRLDAGVYFVSMQADGERATRKLVLR